MGLQDETNIEEIKRIANNILQEDSNIDYSQEFINEAKKCDSMDEITDFVSKKLGEFKEVADWNSKENGGVGNSHKEVFNNIAQESNKLTQVKNLIGLKKKELLSQLDKGEIELGEYGEELKKIEQLEEVIETQIIAKEAACIESHTSVGALTKTAHPEYNVGGFETTMIYDGFHLPLALNKDKDYAVVNWNGGYKYKNMPSVFHVTRDWMQKYSFAVPTGVDNFYTADGLHTACYFESVPGLEFDQHAKRRRLKPLDLAMGSKTPSDAKLSFALDYKGTGKKLLNSTHTLSVELEHDSGDDTYYGKYKADRASANYEGKVKIGDKGAEATLYGQAGIGKSNTNTFVIQGESDDGLIDFFEKKNNFIVPEWNVGVQFAGNKYEKDGIESQGFVNVEHAQYLISDNPEIQHNKGISHTKDRYLSARNDYTTFVGGSRINTADKNSKIQVDGAVDAGVKLALGQDCFGKGKIYGRYHLQPEGTVSAKGTASICTQDKKSIDKGRVGFGLAVDGYASSNFSPFSQNNEAAVGASGFIKTNKFNNLKTEAGVRFEESRLILEEFPGAYVEKTPLARLSVSNDIFNVTAQAKNFHDASKRTYGINTTVNLRKPALFNK